MFDQNETFSGYSVSSLDEAEKFYGDVLGFSVERTKEGLTVTSKNQPLFLYEKGNHQPATFTVLNIQVPDIDAAVEELEKAGIPLEKYPNMYQDEKGITRGKAEGMGPDIAWFKDPAGNIISVLAG